MILLATVVIAVAGVPALAQFRPPADSPLARGEHPRLHLTPDTLVYFRNKIAKYYRSEFQMFVDWVDGRFSVDFDSKGYWMEDDHALIWVLGRIPGVTYGHPLSEYGDRAVSILLARTRTDPTSINAKASDWNSSLPASVARAYDWTWGHMSVAERATVRSWMARLGDHLLTSHFVGLRAGKPKALFSSAYFESYKPYYLGLAFYADASKQDVAQALLDSFDTLMLNGKWLDTINWVASEKGGVAELGNYGLWHTYRHIVNLDGWRTATGIDYFVQSTEITTPSLARTYPRFYCYRMKPAQPDILVKWGQIEPGDGSGSARETLAVLGEPLKRIDRNMAALNRWNIDRQELDQDWGRPYHLPLLFLFGDRTVAAKSPDDLDLPRTEFFDKVGLLAMRTGFDRADDTLLVFGAPTYQLSGHSWENRGQRPLGFTIDKFGPLILNYGGDNRGMRHRQNVLRFQDPLETPDGGFSKLRSGGVSITEYTPESSRNWLGITRLRTYEQTGSFDYAFADVSKNYLDSRVVSCTRQLVFLRASKRSQPDFVVIFDRAESTRANVAKKWEFCMAYDPRINGVRSSAGKGRWRYTGADEVVVTNQVAVDPYSGETIPENHGRAFVKTLLPRSVVIEKTGGPGFEFMDEAGKRGVPADMAYLRKYGAWLTGTYYVDVMPKARNLRDNFLHVIQAGDARTVSKMTATSLIESTAGRMQGAFVRKTSGQDNLVVLFGEKEAVVSAASEAISYRCGSSADSGRTRHIIADLVAGKSYEIVDTDLATGDSVSQTVSAYDARTPHGLESGVPAAGVLTFTTQLSGTHQIWITEAGSAVEPPGVPPSPPTDLTVEGM